MYAMKLEDVDYEIISLEVRQAVRRKTKNILCKLWLPATDKKMSAFGFSYDGLKQLAKEMEGIAQRFNRNVPIYASDLERCSTLKDCVDYFLT
jgi:hypothetical protein